MYTAILNRKNGGKITKHISKALSFIDIDQIDNSANPNFQKYIDLTPDNIINKGGFTTVGGCDYKKTRFELVDQILKYSGTILIYEEI